MMNGPMPISGAAVGIMSGTSAPPQALPFQYSTSCCAQGLPLGSALARLYRMRRLAGQE
jgi:hypothetical protein